MSRQNYSVARVKTRTQDSVGKFERHIERKNEHYANMNVDLERTPMNIQYRSCGELTYNEVLQKLVDEGKVSMRGLKKRNVLLGLRGICTLNQLTSSRKLTVHFMRSELFLRKMQRKISPKR